MFNSRGAILLGNVALLIAADAFWLWVIGQKAVDEMPFQKATGGIGLAAAISPAWSFFSVDPRIEAYCENELWPIPGGTCFNPHHGAAIVDLPPLDAFVQAGGLVSNALRSSKRRPGPPPISLASCSNEKRVQVRLLVGPGRPVHQLRR